MPDIEILAYTPIDMDDFIDFAINGKPKNGGGFETDPDGREIVGVLRWLHGRGVPEAHFFNSAKGDDVQLFAATVQKPVNEPDRPWMKEIPGFDVMVKTDGLIGRTVNFAPIATLLASVVSNADMDQRFVDGKTKVDTILKSIQRNKDGFSFGEEEFLAALRGDKGSDPKAVFAEAEKTFKISL